MNQKEPSLLERSKIKGLLSFVHFVAGSSMWVKSVIVSSAIAAGYGGALYYKATNPISLAASEVVEIETGIHIEFTDPEIKRTP